MGWKDLGYWLRGGMISLVLGIILILLANFTTISSGVGFYPNFTKAQGFLIITALPAILFAEFIGISFSSFDISVKLYLLIYYFLIGAIIGWIYGKIRGNKSGRK